MYTTATLAASFGVPFLATLPVAGVLAALLGTGIGAVVFRVKRLRGELFGLLTLAVTFVLATIVLNTRIDGGPGVYLLGVPIPRLVASPAGTIYLLGLALAVATVLTAHRVSGSRLGLGLFAIHDDEDVAEVKGVPTFRYKLVAFALSAGIAGVAGGIHAVYVSYVTVGRDVRHHRPALRRPDEHSGRRAPLAGAGRRRHDHHRVALRLHAGRVRGDRARRRGLRPHPRHPAPAGGRGPRGAPPVASMATTPRRD